MLRNKKFGFTLLEIIVVLIIVGIMAALALPALFAQIRRQQAQEAMNTMAIMRNNMETWGLQNNYKYGDLGAMATADMWEAMNMSDPSYTTNAGSKFNYLPSDMADDTYKMTATDLSGDANNKIEQTRGANATMTCEGFGIYVGFC